MAYYLGIDGGGTKTTCVVGDEKSVLAAAVAGPSNIVRVGEAAARRSLHQAVGQACAAAGILPQQVTRTCIGAAGAASPEIAAMVRGVVAEIVSGEVVVTGDMQIALTAAFDRGPGIVAVAGTGSIVYGRDAAGNTARAGGWGFAVSDEGSAYWIGRNAVAALLRAWDLLPETERQGTRSDQIGRRRISEPDFQLFHAVREAWNVNSIDQLVRAANATPAPDFAALFPPILACADAGDEMARHVLSSAGFELAQLAARISLRLFPQTSVSPDAGAGVPLAMAGGVFRHSGLVREVFYNEVVKRDPRVQLLAQVVDPLEGALRMARST